MLRAELAFVCAVLVAAFCDPF